MTLPANDALPRKSPEYAEVHDITAVLGSAATYPGDREFHQEWMARVEQNDSFSLSALTLSSHAGTHLDAPAHFFPNGRTLDQYPADRFVLPAQVVDVEGDDVIRPSALKDLSIAEGEALLFRTDNSVRSLLERDAFSERFVHLSEDAARSCADAGVSMVGIDYLSVDRYGDESVPVHRCLLEKDILILEGIDLRDVCPGRYMLFCLPLRIKNAEAAPARAILVRRSMPSPPGEN